MTRSMSLPQGPQPPDRARHDDRLLPPVLPAYLHDSQVALPAEVRRRRIDGLLIFVERISTYSSYIYSGSKFIELFFAYL